MFGGDIPIIATDEVAESMRDNPQIWGAGMTNAELENVTDENFERLFQSLEPLNATEIVAGGLAVGALVKLWPYVMGYIRGRLAKEKLRAACMRVLPESGKAFASRLVFCGGVGACLCLVAAGPRGPDHDANCTGGRTAKSQKNDLTCELMI